MKINDVLKSGPAILPGVETDKVAKLSNEGKLAWYYQDGDFVKHVKLEHVFSENWQLSPDNSPKTFNNVFLGKTKTGNIFIKDSNDMLPENFFQEGITCSLSISINKNCCQNDECEESL